MIAPARMRSCWIPAIAIAGAGPGRRTIGSAPRINVLASGLTFVAGVSLLFAARVRSDILIIDDFNIFLVTITTFVAFTTSIFSASYIGHELETGRLTPVFLRFYHALYQAMIGAMNVALVANNIGLMWVGVEVATLSTVMMVGIYRTPEAVEAAWKYFILGSVGIALAFFGTILVYLVAQEVLGEGLPAMAWDLMVQKAASFDPRLLSLAFVFLLVGYGTKVGLAPFHAWLPDAHAEGPTPISAVLSGLLLNVALYALLRFKMLLAANPATLNVGVIMIVLGLVSLVFAAFMLYRRRDIKRLFAYSSIEHMGIITFAFGMGGPLANFAGLLHMTMHSLTKSAIFFAVGHIAQVKGTQQIAHIRGLSVTHPVLAVGLALGVIAIAGLPPFGIFLSEFMLVSSTLRAPAAARRRAGVRIADRVRRAASCACSRSCSASRAGRSAHVKASYVPLFLHLAVRADRRAVAAGAGRALVPRRRGAARVIADGLATASPRCCRACRRLPATGRGRATRSMPTPGLRSAGARRRRRRSPRPVGRTTRTCISRCAPTALAQPCVVSIGHHVRRLSRRSAAIMRRRSGSSARSATSTATAAIGAPDRRPWLDHGAWGMRAPLGAARAERTARSRRLRIPARARRGPARDSGRPGARRHHRAGALPLHRQRRDGGAAGGAARLRPQGHRPPACRCRPRAARSRSSRASPATPRSQRALRLRAPSRPRSTSTCRSARGAARRHGGARAHRQSPRRHRRDLQRRGVRASSMRIAASCASGSWRRATSRSGTG